MRIFLHIGPHKTGTTSIQAYLRARHGSATPEGPRWYPEALEKGPGHAHLASLMNNPSRETDSNPLAAIVDEAQRASVETLILSSEDFVGAYPRRLPGYADAFASHEVVLVSTQNSLPNRVASLWQELVKHGHQDGMARSIEKILNRNEFRPDFLEAFARALHPREIVIVYSDPNDKPGVLIHRFLSAIELPVETDGASETSLRRNVRLGWIEIETLRHFNQVLARHAPDIKDEEYNVLRNVLLRGFRSDAWRQQAPHLRIETPSDVIERAVSAAERLAAGIEALSRGWPVRTLGNPETLLTVNDTEVEDDGTAAI